MIPTSSWTASMILASLYTSQTEEDESLKRPLDHVCESPSFKKLRTPPILPPISPILQSEDEWELDLELESAREAIQRELDETRQQIKVLEAKLEQLRPPADARPIDPCIEQLLNRFKALPRLRILSTDVLYKMDVHTLSGGCFDRM